MSKRRIITICVMLAAIIATGALPAFADYSTGLAGYWPMDVENGGTTPDTSGLGNNGELREIYGREWYDIGIGPTLTTDPNDAKFGHSYSFDGSNDVITANGPTLSIDGTYTIGAWIRRTEGSTYGAIMRIGGETVNPDYNFLTMTIAYDDSYFGGIGAYMLENQIDSAATDAVIPMSPGTWYYVAATYEDRTLSLYVNGIFKDSVYVDFTTSIPGNPGVTRIGNNYDYISECPAGGVIDDAAVWSGRALTGPEISAYFNSGKPLGDQLGGEAPEPATVVGVVLVAVGVIIRGIKRRGKLMLVSSS